ncbi:energy-coupling factor transporter transmembrane protein EcfT [Thermococcus sp. 101 C5]|uniref:energy-coupling factor transporter transmembrane component T family protein n=1 Tax=Thermococcus sp. 101 C5 TaxID=2654197 RepID=UPI00128BF56D|nr:energy-coupling factor transporter transmembrane component T [Thermococcus sp. 101 C5]MDK2983193.1 energy-coupling factor transport system permease protein [Thermococcaceae archaeon]MPW38907.1 energy-coupling factor transporter transmembrane protein EcfT [Thermococcus sp. 101 C5]
MMYTLYLERDSLIHRLDPRVKIIGSFFGIVALILFNSPLLLFSIFLLIVSTLVLLGKITIKEIFKALKPIIPISIVAMVIWPFILKPWYFGLFIGFGYGIRLLSVALLTLGLIMTTPQRDLILGFIKMGMPYGIGLTLTIALRYIPTLYILAQTIMDAQKSRGLELEKGNFIQRAKNTVPILIPLIVASIKTAHELSIALESRAFGASKRRTFLYNIKMKARDYIALGIVSALFFLAVYARYFLGIGYIELF